MPQIWLAIHMHLGWVQKSSLADSDSGMSREHFKGGK